MGINAFPAFTPELMAAFGTHFPIEPFVADQHPIPPRSNSGMHSPTPVGILFPDQGIADIAGPPQHMLLAGPDGETLTSAG